MFIGPKFLKKGFVIKQLITNTSGYYLSSFIANYFLSTIVADHIASAILTFLTNASPLYFHTLP